VPEHVTRFFTPPGALSPLPHSLLGPPPFVLRRGRVLELELLPPLLLHPPLPSRALRRAPLCSPPSQSRRTVFPFRYPPP
jgi:hypothetical protein